MKRKNHSHKAVSLSKFSYDKATKQLTAFSSDLGALREGLQWLQPIYRDADDYGIIVRSHKTGKEFTFVLDSQDIKEGDLRSWTFVPEDPRTKAESRVNKVIIFND